MSPKKTQRNPLLPALLAALVIMMFLQPAYALHFDLRKGAACARLDLTDTVSIGGYYQFDRQRNL